MFSGKYNNHIKDNIPNQFFMNCLNPFYPTHRMAITITYPLLPFIDDENSKKKDLPEVTTGDILALVPQYRELLEQNGDVMVMLSFLIDLSKHMVSYEIVGNDTIYKYLVIMHVVHNLTMQIRDLKDESNMQSLNDEAVEKNYYLKDMKELFEKNERDSFNMTLYGRRFIEMYYPLLEADIKNNIKRIDRIRRRVGHDK